MVRTKQGIKAPLEGDKVEENKEDQTAEVDSTTEAPPANPKDSNAEDAAEPVLPDSTVENKEKEAKDAPKKSSKKAKKAVVPLTEEEKAALAEAQKAEAEAEKLRRKKRTVPTWTTLSGDAKNKIAKTATVKVARGKIEDEVVKAIQAVADIKGNASASKIRNYMSSKLPETPKHHFKRAVLKAVDRKIIKQTKGIGFNGWFRLETESNRKKAAASGKKKSASSGEKVPLDEVFPLVFTWACNPKEASVNLIRKYVGEHYPELDVDGTAFRKAIEAGENKGQLQRITGKGFSGTFSLVDGASKTGAKFEDAIETAIIAMNEPKDVSVQILRDYIGEYHKEYNTDNRPDVLKKALERSETKGHLVRLTGKGFSGTFRLNWPFHPSPQLLWGDEYSAPAAAKSSRKRSAAADDDDSGVESEDENEEVMPAPKKRGAPKARASAKPVLKKTKPAAKSKPGKKAAVSKRRSRK